MAMAGYYCSIACVEGVCVLRPSSLSPLLSTRRRGGILSMKGKVMMV